MDGKRSLSESSSDGGEETLGGRKRLRTGSFYSERGQSRDVSSRRMRMRGGSASLCVKPMGVASSFAWQRLST